MDTKAKAAGCMDEFGSQEWADWCLAAASCQMSKRSVRSSFVPFVSRVWAVKCGSNGRLGCCNFSRFAIVFETNQRGGLRTALTPLTRRDTDATALPS